MGQGPKCRCRVLIAVTSFLQMPSFSLSVELNDLPFLRTQGTLEDCSCIGEHIPSIHSRSSWSSMTTMRSLTFASVALALTTLGIELETQVFPKIPESRRLVLRTSRSDSEHANLTLQDGNSSRVRKALLIFLVTQKAAKS